MRVDPLLLILAAFCGCGYHMGSLTPDHVRTIAVPIFHNRTLYRDWEFVLTGAVIQQILTGTNLRVTSTDSADTVLIGEITRVGQSTVTKDETRLATQFDVSISVNVEWQDRRTGKAIYPKREISESMHVFADRGENFQTAVQVAVAKLARSVVYSLERPLLLWEP